jgi:FtsP/CotA-like multicopper oxidase with cupredoxin domain/plastocyanin
MAEWQVVITGPAGSATFTPNPQPASSGDTVFWSNQSDAGHTIVIDGQDPLVPMPAPSWKSSKPAFQVPDAPATVVYRCSEAGHGSEIGRIVVTALFLMALLAGFFAPALKAQVMPCDTVIGRQRIIGGELESPAEVGVRDGVKPIVRGTLVTSGEKQLVAFPKPNRVTTGPITFNDITCAAQWMRAYRNDEPGPDSQKPSAPVTLPQPGPTIRAKVGDLVELTFLNLIDDLNFPGTDTGDCDKVQGKTGPVYPQTDSMPNCFHGSVFTNVHFHGTHTSPNSTADNVFLEIVPSPRSKSSARTPGITAASVKDQFNEFFGNCEKNVNNPNSAQIWPHIWDQLPKGYRDDQDKYLEPAQPKLFAANGSAIRNGAFPQNYIGAFPYCFRLPVWTANPATVPTAASHGEGSTEHDDSLTGQPVIMGQAPGTHWYHAHKHGSTTLNVANGMTGVMIIEGDYDAQIRRFYKSYYSGIKEKVIVLNQIGQTPNREGGNVGNPGPYFSVNGRIQPNVTMKPGEVQWWRIANTSARTGVIFTLPAGLTWRQLAQDGVQFTNDNYMASENKEFLLAAGNRADLLVKAKPFEGDATYPIMVALTVDPTTNRRTTQLLLNVKTEQRTTLDQDVPFMDRSEPKVPFPPFLTDIPDNVPVTATKTLVFASDRVEGEVFTKHTIDGKRFDGQVGALVLMNQVEEWKIVNRSFSPKIAHPFHIHINPFQVVEIFDPNEKLADGTTPRYTTGTPTGLQCHIDVTKEETWTPCDKVPKPSNVWRDVFSIPSGNTFDKVNVPGYFKMRSRFVDYSGYYVMHCHILSHEDTGMMTVVYVAPLQPPFSHH